MWKPGKPPGRWLHRAWIYFLHSVSTLLCYPNLRADRKAGASAEVTGAWPGDPQTLHSCGPGTSFSSETNLRAMHEQQQQRSRMGAATWWAGIVPGGHLVLRSSTLLSCALLFELGKGLQAFLGEP